MENEDNDFEVDEVIGIQFSDDEDSGREAIRILFSEDEGESIEQKDFSKYNQY